MKVLIIEDDIFFQKFYASKLTEKGFEVAAASNGEEGLRAIPIYHPDIILLDLIMPKKNGFDVLQGMAEHPEWKKVPVLIFSTLSQEKDVQEGLKLGAVGYINKAVEDFENSFAKISSVVQK